MARDLTQLDAEYELDSPWTPGDPNALAQRSVAFVDNFAAGHRKSDGTHDDPLVPIASAIVTYSGGSYTTAVADHCTISKNAGVGSLRLTLDAGHEAVDADSWFVVAQGGPDDNAIFGCEDPSSGIKDDAKADVQLFATNLTAADASFIVTAYGRRAA